MSEEPKNFIRTEIVDEHILVITIDRPEARNALTRAMAVQMEGIIDNLDADPALRVAIIRGEGSTFCAGQDLKAAAKREIATSDRRGGFGFLSQPPLKPLIAAIEGHAYAGGLELALACDLIVASRESQFALTEVKWAIMAAGGGVFRLPRRIPYHIAMEMILTALPKSASEMAAFGLVNRVAEPGQALEAALVLARQIIVNGPLAVAGSKEVVFRSMAERWSETDAWEKQKGALLPIVKSQDQIEGLKAFAERRAPVWTGR
jgi:enoyl-CoA hydratase